MTAALLTEPENESRSAEPISARGSVVGREAARLLALHDADDALTIGRVVAELRIRHLLDFPLPGDGRTRDRFEAFEELAAIDLSIARLSEGHADAVAILREAGHVEKQALYGVWAAEPPNAIVEATRAGERWVLRGTKKFCSGASSLGRALVTAKTAEGSRLFDVDLAQPNVRRIAGTWPAIGMAASDSLDVDFDGTLVDDAGAIGAAGFYVHRPGFWQGAVGVAACWLGGATGALRMTLARFRRMAPDAHQLAHLGRMIAMHGAMKATLEQAADAIDADPLAERSDGHLRALVVRQTIEAGCQEIMRECGLATGTGPMVFDRRHARRSADLQVYLRQHHAERDLAELGKLALANGEAP